MNEIIVIVISVIGGGLISSLATRFVLKKQYEADVESTNTENMHKSLDFYVKALQLDKAKLDDVINENKQLAKDNLELKKENMKLREENVQLRSDINSIMVRLSALEDKNTKD